MTPSIKKDNKIIYEDGVILEFVPARKPKPKEPTPPQEEPEPIEVPIAVPA